MAAGNPLALMGAAFTFLALVGLFGLLAVPAEPAPDPLAATVEAGDEGDGPGTPWNGLQAAVDAFARHVEGVDLRAHALPQENDTSASMGLLDTVDAWRQQHAPAWNATRDVDDVETPRIDATPTSAIERKAERLIRDAPTHALPPLDGPEPAEAEDDRTLPWNLTHLKTGLAHVRAAAANVTLSNTALPAPSKENDVPPAAETRPSRVSAHEALTRISRDVQAHFRHVPADLVHEPGTPGPRLPSPHEAVLNLPRDVQRLLRNVPTAPDEPRDPVEITPVPEDGPTIPAPEDPPATIDVEDVTTDATDAVRDATGGDGDPPSSVAGARDQLAETLTGPVGVPRS